MSLSAPHLSQALILASASPRRAVLLRQAGYTFRVVEPSLPEPRQLRTGVPPAEEAEALSYFKARAVARTEDRGLILAADTVVACEGHVFGKADDEAQARKMLSCLMHHPHEVITGVTLLDAHDERRLLAHDVTQVTMRRVSEKELDDYLAGGDWVGKAGAYGIQDDDDPFVESIRGSFTNVVGLPLELVARMLADWPPKS